MDRSESYLHMIDAFAKQQIHVAFILQAKAAEAEKSRDWVLEYMQDGAFGDHREQVKQAGEVHERIIGIIDGIVKIQNGFARNMKLLLNQAEDDGSDMSAGGLFGSLFSGSGSGGKDK